MSWLPDMIRFPKHSYLIIRSTDPKSYKIKNTMFQTKDDIPFPVTDWEEKETRLIHTEQYTWSVDTNNFYTMTTSMFWISPDKKWHASLIQRHPILFKFPMLRQKDILFSERELKKQGIYMDVPWIQSEKGFRFVINSSDQVSNLKRCISSL